jgi:hypothetical protein
VKTPALFCAAPPEMQVREYPPPMVIFAIPSGSLAISVTRNSSPTFPVTLPVPMTSVAVLAVRFSTCHFSVGGVESDVGFGTFSQAVAPSSRVAAKSPVSALRIGSPFVGRRGGHRW